MDPKLLTEDGWKALVQKFKLKDKDLQKALFFYENLEDDDFEFRLKGIGKVAALAGALKKDKEVVANAPVVKYLADMITASQTAQRDIAKEKAEADKAKALDAKNMAANQKKEEAEAKKGEEEGGAGAEEDEDEEEEGDALKKLTTSLKTLKLSKKPYYFLVCDAKPYGLIVSKKDIRKSMQARKDLAQLAGGSTRPPKFGECRFENGKIVFEMEKPPSGLARILQKWIKESTGLGLKVMVGGESGESEDEEQQGEGEKIEPIAPPKLPRPELAKAPEVWQGTRDILDNNIKALKRAIQTQCADEAPDLVEQIENNMEKLDSILEKLDNRLGDSLTKASAITDAAARKAELKNAKVVLAEYITYVKSEPLIALVDENPFGVKTNLKTLLSSSLTHMAQSIG